MKYTYLLNNIVQEVIPEYDPTFPDIPISERYAADFLSHVVEASDDITVGQAYDPETGTFGPAPELIVDDSITTTPDELDIAYRSGVNSYE